MLVQGLDGGRACRALCQDGTVIDLSGMRGVTVDPRAKVATIMGGALTRDAAAACAPHGLVPALGTCGGVGVAGLTLGGGHGPFNGLYGLSADNLLAADVLPADGRRVTASPDQEPELFWALRGGGGNFGAVTAMQVRLHDPGPGMLAGAVVFPWDQAEAVLRRYADFAPLIPDGLGVGIIMTPGPDGAPALQFQVIWAGERDAGERAMEALQALGRLSNSSIRLATYPGSRCRPSNTNGVLHRRLRRWAEAHPTRQGS